MRCRLMALAALVCIAVPRASAAQGPAFSLEGLVVTASPTAKAVETVANHVTILEGDDLRVRGLTSVADALREVPGLGVVRNGSFGAATSVFLRGGESDYTLVLVDGVQVNLAGGGYDFAALTTDNVDRIEILRGPSSALYGSDAVSGVIQVITRSGRGPPKGSARVELGSYRETRGRAIDGLRWSADVTGGTERAGYSLSLSHAATDGVLDFNNRHVNTALSGSARFLPDDETRIGLTLRLADRRYHFPTDGSGAVVDHNSFTYSDETLAHVSVARRVTGRLELEALVGLSESDGGLDDAPDGPADTLGFYGFSSLDHFRRMSGELRANLSLGRGVLTGGWEVEEERQLSFTESASEFGPSNGRSESRRRNQAVFAHATGERGAFAFNTGVRLEDNDRFGTVGTWQAGVSIRLPGRGGTRLRASLGSALKEPTFFENFATGFAVGNPDLDPERSVAWEVGLEHDLAVDAVTVRATYFEQRFEDLIQYTFAPPRPTDPNFFNVAGARSRGVELTLAVKVGSASGGVDWTWLDTEVTDAGFDSGPGATFVEGEALLRRPSHTLALHASTSVGSRGHVHTRLSVVGSRPDRDFASFPAVPVELPRHALLALGGEWRLWSASSRRPRVSLSVRGENLFGREYEEVLGFPAPGRQLYVGASVGLGAGS